ncbi:MAG: YjjG family noncanonical pyrimidine nucleotidase [Muribaculaceae bacterium]|nr:YjjG family noncanonical pyrimidine nucleotidase [Muribaculaceae bacterium]
MKWIFFDLDDTLWNFTANSAVALRKLYEISPILKKLFKDISEFINIYHDKNQLLWDLYAQGKVTTNQLKVERWRLTLSTRQFEVLTAVCEELDRNYLDILAQESEKIEGVEELLEKISKNSLIAVLSNGFSKTQYKKLHYSGLEKYINRVIVSEEIGINKPNKKLFDYSISETGATPPYLMVGDHAQTDIIGAMKAGWHAIWYNPEGKPFPLSEVEMQTQGIDSHLLVGIVKNMTELYKAIQNFYK